MKISNFLKFIISIVVVQFAGFIGSIFTSSSLDTWYNSLIRPDIAPPNWIFAPVWTTLFILMGISAFLIWKQGLDRREVKIALGFFLFQLVLNTLWSIIFFGLQNPAGAFVEIIILWFAILANIIIFARLSKLASWLLVPYILWVSFATYLNYQFWIINY